MASAVLPILPKTGANSGAMIAKAPVPFATLLATSATLLKKRGDSLYTFLKRNFYFVVYDLAYKVF